jgi:S1-C subfamily serine protease
VLRIDERVETVRAKLKPLTVSPEFTSEVGTAVSVIGFPFGAAAMVRPEAETALRLYRVGPVLQQGFVSAIAPFDESYRVDRLLLDVRTTEGMSGAAVVNSESGEVIGVHTSGYDKDPSVLAFAAPLNQSVIESILEQVDRLLVGEAASTGQMEIRVPIVRRFRSDGPVSS